MPSRVTLKLVTPREMHQRLVIYSIRLCESRDTFGVFFFFPGEIGTSFPPAKKIEYLNVELYRERGCERAPVESKNRIIRDEALCAEKGDDQRAPSTSRVAVYPRQRAATCKIYDNARPIPLRCCKFQPRESAVPPPLYTLFITAARQPYDYLLAARSSRGRSGPSKRVSNIHESDRTHPDWVIRNMRAGVNTRMRRACMAATCATEIRVWIDTLSTSTRPRIGARQSRIPFTSLMPRQLKKSPGWEYLASE